MNKIYLLIKVVLDSAQVLFVNLLAPELFFFNFSTPLYKM